MAKAMISPLSAHWNWMHVYLINFDAYDPETIEEVNTIITNNETIDIDFTLYTAKQLESVTSTKPSPSRKPSSTNSQQHTRQPAQFRNATKRLRSLLRMLMHSDSFATSDIEINTGVKHPFKAKNLFINFDDITENNLGKWRGYWGVISHADPNINWLNTANKQDVSIPISELRSYIMDIFSIEIDEDLTGATVLVFGKLSISKSEKKKWYIKIVNNNPSHLFIKLKK
jgi:hypothetical protein